MSRPELIHAGFARILEDSPPPLEWDAIQVGSTQIIGGPVSTRRPGGRSAWALGMVTVVLVVASTVLASNWLQGDPSAVSTPPIVGPSTTAPRSDTTTTSLPGSRESFVTDTEVLPDLGWLKVTLPSQVTVGNGVMIWTGDEVIFWGGQDTLDQPYGDPGVAYSTSTNTWRELPPSPKPAVGFGAAVWTGSEVIICCGQGAGSRTVAAYNPSTDSWRSIAGSPLGSTPGAAVWTGEEVLMAAGETVAAYNPSTDTWREFPRNRNISGTLGRLKEVAWTGTELIIWPAEVARRTYQGYALDPETGNWRTLPDPPAWPAAPDIAWTGTELIIWGGLPAEHQDDSGRAVGSRYNPTANTWTEMPEVLPEPQAPSHEGNLGSQTLLWTGSDLVVSTGLFATGLSSEPLLLSYDPSTDEWRMIGVSPVQGYNASGAVMAGDHAVLRWHSWIFISPPQPWATQPIGS